MKLDKPENVEPRDASVRRHVSPIVCYPVDTLPSAHPVLFTEVREGLTVVDEIIIQPRDAGVFHVPAGNFFRIVSVEG